MRIAVLLRNTILETIEFYKNYGRKLFELSLYFSIASVIFAAALAFILCILGQTFFELGGSTSTFFDSVQGGDDLRDYYLLEKFQKISTSIVIFNLSIYALYIVHLKKEVLEKAPGFLDLFRNINTTERRYYLILLGVLLLINFGLYLEVFDVRYREAAFFGLPYDLEIPGPKWKFYVWVNAIIELILYYLPYVLAMFLLIISFEGKINKGVLNQYKNAILASLILSFCLAAIATDIQFYVNYYIIALIEIPFVDKVISLILTFAVGIFILAFFVHGAAALIGYPFQYVADRLEDTYEEEE